MKKYLIALTITLTASLCYSQGVITTVAGTGTCCANADNASALLAYLQGPDGLTIDSLGNFYIWESQLGRIRKVSTSGTITTVAGIGGMFGSSGDGGPATSALLQGGTTHAGLAFDNAGNLYISDTNNHRIRKVNSSGVISTVAGNGSQGFSGDNGPATSAMLYYPEGIAVDAAGNLYIADTSNLRIRKVSPSGTITTVAGNGNVVFSGDGGPATSAALTSPNGVTVDNAGNIYIADGRRVRKVNTAGIISTVAGTGVAGSAGDGGPGTSAELKAANGITVDSAGNIYFADVSNQRIRKIDAAGIITTIAGNTLGYSGDGGLSTSALLATPHDVVLDAAGNIILTDTGNHRVRKIAASGGPSISATPGTLLFAYTIGGAIPAAQTMSISSSGAALSFSASASTTTGGNWLTVNPTSGTSPASLSVSVTPTGLPGGVYQGAITLTPSGAPSATFSVSLTVTGAGAPSFTAASIVNATGYQNKLAPDTVFAIFGSNMGPATLVAAAGPNYPLSLGGTSITFTPASGGSPIDAKLVYSVAGQIAGLLPSSIAPGPYAVRVTYNTLTSAPQNVNVVARSFGIATSNSAGSGVAQATIGNVNGGISLTRFTAGTIAFGGLNWTLGPTHPGDTVVLWGTGGGADPANDTGGTSGDQTAAGNFIVNVDGRPITPLYAGASSGYPGLWQVNFTLPADITLDCFASVQVSAGGELSNSVIIPIAGAGQASCVDPNTPSSILTKLDAGGNIVIGAFALGKIASSTTAVANETASGSILSFSAAEWLALTSGPLFGACRVYDRTYPVGGLDPSTPDAYLDAGSTLSLAGPNLAAGTVLTTVATPRGNAYAKTLAAGTLTGGTYTLAGAGGTQVGSFSVPTSFPASFTVTNFDTTTVVDRSKPLTFNWTGSSFDQVAIVVSTAVATATTRHLTTITCTVPGAPGSYSVPAAALAYLSPAAASGAAFGTIAVEGLGKPGSFTANLLAGGQIDWGTFSSNYGLSKNIAVQ
jgi:uncharacterized protein (TIGR03437 family)